MRYDDPDLQDRLAGEYVLGTLPVRTKRRFETLMRGRPDIRERVIEWQSYLGPLDEETAPVEPPAGVLRRLHRWLGPGQAMPDVALQRRLTIWRIFGVASAGLALLLAAAAIHLAREPNQMELIGLGYESGLGYVAVLQDETGKPGLVVTARLGISRIVVEPLSELTTPDDGVFQLWAIEGGGEAAYSLATFPGGTAFEVALTGGKARHMQTATSLFVSREPTAAPSDADGSGGPTGPILYSGRWISLKGPSEF